MRRWTRLAGAALAASLVLGGFCPDRAVAVVILDSTWREEGGARGGREADGFGAHIALANQPQFRPLVTLSYDGGNEWGSGSGTWIGNDGSGGYILTSAHNFDDAELREVLFRTDGGSVLRGSRVWIHPGYQVDGDHTGVDVAIVRLEAPVTDAGPAPVLYAGNAEQGRMITFVGFGTRGIGSVGEDERYNRGSGKAAAQGVVDEAVALRRGSVRMEDPGNYLTVFLPREDGSVANPNGGTRRPVSRLAGLLGSGDSGGSAWMPHGDGWAIVGINTSGDGNAQYGDNSWFVRVSGVRPWIASVFPQARFTGDGTSPLPPATAQAPSEAPTKEQPPREAPTAPALTVAARPEQTISAGCTLRQRLFVYSDEAWYPARVVGNGKRPGSCRVRFDDYDDEDDESVGTDRMLPWSPDGPGTGVAGCRSGAPVLVEEDEVWYPATIVRAVGRSCRIAYDEDDDEEVVPPARLRSLR